jgi:signal transduction histidine kinase
MSLQGSAGLIADPEAANRVRQAVDALDETIRDIRSAIFTLQSRPQARPAGIRARILEIVGPMTETLGFGPSVRMEERLDALVPPEMAEQLLAVLREALSNVARHAGASRVSIAVTAGSDLTLTVRDDGGGMEGSARRSGLGNLADRASTLGGTLRVGPAEGGGTELEWCVPLPPGDQSAG